SPLRSACNALHKWDSQGSQTLEQGDPRGTASPLAAFPLAAFPLAAFPLAFPLAPPSARAAGFDEAEGEGLVGEEDPAAEAGELGAFAGEESRGAVGVELEGLAGGAGEIE